MLLREITQPLDEKQIWGRRGKDVVRKFRCTVGKRKGRIVAKIAQCFAAPNVKAKILFPSFGEKQLLLKFAKLELL